MIGAKTSGASTATRSWQRRWTPALAGVGIVVLAVTACGSSGTTAIPTATPAAANGTPTHATSPAAAFPGVVGTAAAVSGSSLEVQNPTSGQVTVTFTASTPITDTVSAGGFGGGGFGGFGRGGGAGATPRPSFSARPRPTGSAGAFGNGTFGGADGKVTSVSASGFVVQARGRTAGSGTATDTSVTVITTSASKYLKTVTAGASALKVGLCVTAVGTANSIGAVAARSIRISQPGPSGCVSGFGGRGGFGRPSTNA